MKKIFASILIIFWTNAYASPGFPTGEEIISTCSNLSDVPSQFENTSEAIDFATKQGLSFGTCYTAMGTSFSAITDIGYRWSANDEFARCMENYYGFDKFNSPQILAMVLKFLKENPKYRSFSINTIMATMLKKEFPQNVCSKSARAKRGEL